MKLLTSYILKKCFQNTFMLLFAFAIIYSVIQAIQELGDVGKGSYTTGAMFIYLGALLPSYIYLLLPLSVLIGVMTTTLGLVKNSEYAIMRTSGVSLKSITKVLAVFGIIFAIITFMLGEVIAPEASQFAKVYKLNHTNQIISMDLSSGIWSKDSESNIINIKKIDPLNNQIVESIQIFDYDANQKLKRYITSPNAAYSKYNSVWLLESVVVYDYLESQILISKRPTMSWRSTIEPSYFSVLVISPDDMPAFGLIKYIKHLKLNHESTNRPEIALWSKLLYPFACISMAFIAVGFIPNNGRNVNLSSKLFAGILIGVAFFFTNKMIGFVAVLYSWNAILSAVMPTLILFSIGWIIILKKES